MLRHISWLLLLVTISEAIDLGGGSFPPLKPPQVITKLGKVKGAWLASEKGRNFAAFMAVPYALPPIGTRRFKSPEPMTPWGGEWDASRLPPPCLQYSQLFEDLSEPIQGEEDCLYLNVYTPRVPKSETSRRLPVLIWIHGGAFMFGASEMYGPKLLMDREVVLVTINYRLGPLGFLSLEDAVLPGNYGMKDQSAALRWVKEHIFDFGGDPSHTILLGGSAGGASVHYHYMSPMSQGLFSGGVSISGTALCRWALADGAREKALRLAYELGCPSSGSSQDIVKCLRARPADRIVEQVKTFQVWTDHIYAPYSPFAPVVERFKVRGEPVFLPDDPVKLISRGRIQKLPWVTGVTSAEGLYPVASFIANKKEMERLEQDFNELIPHLLHYNFTVEEQVRDKVTEAIRKEYLGDQKVSFDTVPQIIQMFSDRLFIVDAQEAAEMHAQRAPVYFYVFDYDDGGPSSSDFMSMTKNNYGVSHCDDWSYFLNISYIPLEEPRKGDAARVQSMMLDLWTNFASEGVPKSKDVPLWETVSPTNDEMDYLYIGGVPAVMRKTTDLGNAAFWDYLPLLEGEQSSKLKHKPEEIGGVKEEL